jgi:hypothetical protein
VKRKSTIQNFFTAHSYLCSCTSNFKFLAFGSAYGNIDSLNFFSLTAKAPIQLTPHNLNHHIAEPSLPRTQHIVRPNTVFSSHLSMSNKIAPVAGRTKLKKIKILQPAYHESQKILQVLTWRRVSDAKPGACSLICVTSSTDTKSA